MTLEERVHELERQLDLLTRALHLALVGVSPSLAWLDKATESGTSYVKKK